ncbi:TPA: hypothetical protein QDC27_002542 [Burkholderia cepacia ATCC 25416]|uniref:hypothetical protein n=1 Tax=Burkholderia cepacia TaxID=292 RepID=UPI001CF3C2EA|nr:hypothetical protein [Burkholderia cepacia]HDR9767561.1 hypothetical protein [Burkholderia cepacia ATCC 25416]MCA8074163.1 hypothetical protein [Burkholderia cepacia]HDR9774763.1 hypothetical protein [Burkholderia cepacia ATCC 25416]HDR9783721.1 hypothetical protein [Burkholderia cepacia ATCC 25416]HDR9792643.1 hypothetical protein [Burkholderia cepacia ATCC 25416]
MFHRRSMLGCRNVACVVAVAIMLAPVATRAAADNVNETASVAPAVSANASPTRPIVGDDPVAIREALEKLHVKGTSPSLSERVRGLIPGVADKHGKDTDLAAVNLDREVTFLVPVSYGLRYQSQKRLLKVNVDLVDPDGEGRTGILLRKVITGPRGRGLVIAPEAKAKGYIQQIDIIELDPGKGGKSTVRGSVRLSLAAYAQAQGGFAFALSGRLVRPYLTEHVEHAEPNNDEPTDITTRTSRLHLDVESISLVSRASGAVLLKRLSFSK